MDGLEAEPRQGASALVALGVMVAIALVAAGAVLAWARLAAPAAAEQPPGLDEELPESLPDGSSFADVAPAIAAAVEAPVVGAAPLSGALEGLEDCNGEPLTDERFEAGFVTPDGATVTSTGLSAGFGTEDLTEVRSLCTATWAGGAWQLSGNSLGPLFDVGSTIAFGSSSDGWSVNTAVLDLPAGTAWVVQDRGGYRLAYAVDGLTALPISWRHREGPLRGTPSTSVLLLDSEGDVLEETVVGF